MAKPVVQVLGHQWTAVPYRLHAVVSTCQPALPSKPNLWNTYTFYISVHPRPLNKQQQWYVLRMMLRRVLMAWPVKSTHVGHRSNPTLAAPEGIVVICRMWAVRRSACGCRKYTGFRAKAWTASRMPTNVTANSWRKNMTILASFDTRVKVNEWDASHRFESILAGLTAAVSWRA